MLRIFEICLDLLGVERVDEFLVPLANGRLVLRRELLAIPSGAARRSDERERSNRPDRWLLHWSPRSRVDRARIIPHGACYNARTWAR